MKYDCPHRASLVAQLIKNPSACNAGDLGSIPGLGRSPGEWKGYPLQYSGLESSMDCIVHGVAKSRTRVDFHSLRGAPDKQTWCMSGIGKLQAMHWHALL